MINFTVGPVQSNEEIRRIGAENVPYFRTQEFSDVMLENEALVKKFAKASEASKVVFMTGSGTASMEAAVSNVFTKKDKVLVVNGGSFGQRFVELFELYEIPFTEIKMALGKDLTAEQLKQYDQQGYTGFAVNVHETSTGVHYNIDLIADFCRRNHMLLMVDAISSFLADEFNMSALGVDIMITGSQKALACPPGVSLIVLSERAVERVEHSHVQAMYLDLKRALINARRGQTPFTPAVGILLQINARLKQIDRDGGVEKEIKKIAGLAEYFRQEIKDLPLDICSESLSNAVTPLMTRDCSAYDIFLTLKDEYGIWICPNGGEMADKIFRVGHIGELNKEDYQKLVAALKDLVSRGILK